MDISRNDLMRSRAANNLCHLLYKKGRFDKAVDFALMRIKLCPADFKGYFWLSLLYSKLKVEDEHFQREDKNILTLTNLLLSCWFKSVSMFLYHKNIRAAVPAFFAAIESYPYISMVSDVVQVSNDLELNCQVRSHRSNQIILLTNGSYEIESLDFLHSSLVGIGEKVQITFRSSIVKTIWRRHLMANLSLNFEGCQIQTHLNYETAFPMVIYDCKMIGYTEKFRDQNQYVITNYRYILKNKHRFTKRDLEHALKRIESESLKASF